MTTPEQLLKDIAEHLEHARSFMVCGVCAEIECDPGCIARPEHVAMIRALLSDAAHIAPVLEAVENAKSLLFAVIDEAPDSGPDLGTYYTLRDALARALDEHAPALRRFGSC